MVKKNNIKKLEDKILFYTSRLMFVVDKQFKNALIDEFDDILYQFEAIKNLTSEYQKFSSTLEYSFCDELFSEMQLRDDVVDTQQPETIEILKANKNFNSLFDNYFVIPRIIEK